MNLINNINIQAKNTKLVGSLLALIIGLCGTFWLFGPLMWKPNDFMMSFGGDAYVIYYDLAYHAKYGSGSLLTNMNYPFGEYIFMTDAQGSLAYVLAMLRNLGLDLSNYSLGIMHAFNIFLLPFACVIMYLVLEKLHMRWWMAVIFGCLIIFMSPQMLRYHAHFGLAYPFIIPLVMLWIIKKWEKPGNIWLDICMFLILVFFAFNNPYIGFTSCGFAATTAFLGALYYRKDRKRFIGFIQIFGISTLVLLTLFLVFHYGDFVDDRIKQQWGFFYFFSSPVGFIAPAGSYFNDFLTWMGVQIYPTEFERKENLGLTVTLIATFAFCYLIYFRFTKKIWKPNYLPVMWIMAGAVTLLFVYTSNVRILPINTDWFEEHLGKLLMFKAVARLSWSVYFLLCTFAVYFLDRMLEHQKARVFIPVVSVICMIWMLEINHYIKPYFVNIHHKNFWSVDEKLAFEKSMKDNNITLSDYQAILCIPKLQLWSDKFISETHWATQFHAQRISVFTGLPLINAMLSRQGISHTSSAIQMLADPLIERSRLDDFPNKKPILLVAGAELPPLSDGELYMMSRSKYIYSEPQYTLYEIPIDSIKTSPAIANAKRLYAEGYRKQPILHQSWGESKAESGGFFEPGCLKVTKSANIVFEGPLNLPKDTLLTFSIWTKVDNNKYDIGDFEITVLDLQGKVLGAQELNTRKSYDIQEGWVRTSTKFYNGPNTILRVSMKSPNQSFWVDDLIIDYDGSINLIDGANKDYFFYNGFKIKK